MYDVLVLDLDNTLIDFDYMEIESLKACLKAHGYPCEKAHIDVYQKINKELWEGLEKGLYRKRDILTKRFEKWLEHFTLEGSPDTLNDYYLKGMSDYLRYMPGAKRFLERIQSHYVVVLMTNGVCQAQQKKLDKGQMRRYFDHVIISDDIGFHKPQVEIYDYMMTLIGSYDKQRMLMIGDSLGSDILGGQRFGIDTCYYNPKGQSHHAHPTYEIKHFKEMNDILQNLS